MESEVKRERQRERREQEEEAGRGGLGLHRDQDAMHTRCIEGPDHEGELDVHGGTARDAMQI